MLMRLQFMLYNIILSASFILVRWQILSPHSRRGLVLLRVWSSHIWAVFYSEERIHQTVNLYVFLKALSVALRCFYALKR